MLKKVFNLLKRVVISAFILYGYNLIASPLNLIVPINIITVGVIAVFGLPALFSFIIILAMFF